MSDSVWGRLTMPYFFEIIHMARSVSMTIIGKSIMLTKIQSDEDGRRSLAWARTGF